MTVVDAHRTFNPLCWFCAKQLGPIFTSVKKNGVDLRVHPECRPEALTVVVIEGELVTELPIG